MRMRFTQLVRLFVDNPSVSWRGQLSKEDFTESNCPPDSSTLSGEPFYYKLYHRL